MRHASAIILTSLVVSISCGGSTTQSSQDSAAKDVALADAAATDGALLQDAQAGETSCSTCNDDNPCTMDACQSATSCTHKPVVDGTLCSTDGLCLQGTCTPGVKFAALGDLTGWASSEGTFNRNHAELRCGDDGRGYELYPGLSYDLTALPKGATARLAVLVAHQVRVDGDAPYGASLHTVMIEHVQYAQMWEADEASRVEGTIGQRLLSSSAEVGLRSADVTAALSHEVAAARSQLQLRLRFIPEMTDTDAAPDYAIFASDDDPTESLRPYLLVVYAP